MYQRTDQQKVHSMLIEAITMLCKNGLDYKVEFSVEGLLGITLDHSEVFLVNIKECIKNDYDNQGSTQSQSHDAPSSSPQPDGGRQRSHDAGKGSMPSSSTSTWPPRIMDPHHDLHHDVHHHYLAGRGFHHGQGRGSCNIVERAVTPMHHFKGSPFRRQRGRRKWCGVEALRRKLGEGAAEYADLMHLSMGPPAKRQNVGSMFPSIPPSGRNFNKLANFCMMRKPPQTEKGDILPVSIKHEKPDSDPGSDQEQLQLPESSSEERVIVEPSLSVPGDQPMLPSALAVSETGGGIPSSGFSVASPSSASWPDMDSAPSTPLSSSRASPHKDFSEVLDYEETEEFDPYAQAMISKVRAAILKEDGCFVTSRMLCRRYSSIFKVYRVVQAMKVLTKPLDHPEHFGIFKVLNERTKVFYKCPPNQMSTEVLNECGTTLAKYTELFYKMPRPKGLRSPNWDTFVDMVLSSCPYGRIVHEDYHPALAEEDEVEVIDSFDEFELQQVIMRSEGCFTSSRILCRKIAKNYKVVNVIRAMRAMSRAVGDRHYVGEYSKVSERIKVFYKCPPTMVGVDSLQLYGITQEEYSHLYYTSPRPLDGSVANWDTYIEGVARKYPYRLNNFPLECCDVSPDVMDRIREEATAEEPDVVPLAESAALVASYRASQGLDKPRPAQSSHAARHRQVRAATVTHTSQGQTSRDQADSSLIRCVMARNRQQAAAEETDAVSFVESADVAAAYGASQGLDRPVTRSPQSSHIAMHHQSGPTAVIRQSPTSLDLADSSLVVDLPDEPP